MKITEAEKELIVQLNHPLYTVEFLEQWVNRNDNPMINAPAALQAMGAKGYLEAVRQMVNTNKSSEDEMQCQIKLSLLTPFIDEDEQIIVNDKARSIHENRLYSGYVGGIEQDNPINTYHITDIFPCDDKLVVYVAEPVAEGGTE